jgi:hypothetical protein
MGAETLALALALAVPVSLCAHTEETDKRVRIQNISLKKIYVLFFYQFYELAQKSAFMAGA